MVRGIAWTLWNLFLASLPVIFGRVLGRTPPGRVRAPTWGLALAWLLLLPNTAYLMTEWRHFLFDDPFVRLRENGQSDRTAMFQTAAWGLFFVGYSAAGALFFTLAVRPVEGLLRRRGQSVLPWAPILFILVALGVYVGLFDRLNSWDAVRNPLGVVRRALSALTRPSSVAAILGFAAVLVGTYVAIGYVLEGVAADWARLRAKRRAKSKTSATTPSAQRSDPEIRA